ncbi:hypothetical protein TNCV_1195411 [Trichonephila clavipes]|nr:hypothetical protein TNCV_1195411 [Trichonephila clavipes]
MAGMSFRMAAVDQGPQKSGKTDWSSDQMSQHRIYVYQMSARWLTYIYPTLPSIDDRESKIYFQVDRYHAYLQPRSDQCNPSSPITVVLCSIELELPRLGSYSL